MGAAFDMCVSKGGKVRTKTMSKNRYMHICFMNGKSFAGEVKTKKKAAKKGKAKKAKKKAKKAKKKY